MVEIKRNVVGARNERRNSDAEILIVAKGIIPSLLEGYEDLDEELDLACEHALHAWARHNKGEILCESVDSVSINPIDSVSISVD